MLQSIEQLSKSQQTTRAGECPVPQARFVLSSIPTAAAPHGAGNMQRSAAGMPLNIKLAGRCAIQINSVVWCATAMRRRGLEGMLLSAWIIHILEGRSSACWQNELWC